MIYDVSKGGVHTVRVTLQRDDFKGHIIAEIDCNCHGRDILVHGFEFINILDDNSASNDCELQYDGQTDTFGAALKNAEGEIFALDDLSAEEMNKMIVGLEIIDFIPKK